MTTITTIAKKLGISPATVSRALNAHTQHKVNQETLQRIQKLAQRYHYVPNISARNLVKQKSNIIGVVIPYSHSIFCSEYYMQLLSGVADGMSQTHYNFNLHLAPPHGQEKLIEFLRTKGITGMILSHWTFFCHSIKEIEKIEVPILGVNECAPSQKISFLTCDNFQGAQTAVEYLFKKGHRRIGMILGPEDSVDNRERFRGYQSALKEKGMEYRKEFVLGAGSFEREAGYRAMRDQLNKNREATAYFCANDEITIGALKAIKEKGLRCPWDISIIGFDALKIGEYVDPPITSVEQAIYEIGKEGVRVLIEIIERRVKAPLVRQIPCRLVERSSVAEK